MTITTEDNIAGGYVGDGSTSPVATPAFQQNADIRAVQVTDATGAEVVLVLDTDYTLSGAGNPGGVSALPGGILSPQAASRARARARARARVPSPLRGRGSDFWTMRNSLLAIV